MGQHPSTLCRPPKTSTLCRDPGCQDDNRGGRQRCTLCTEFNGQGKDELRVHKVLDPRLDGLWFDDALLHDAKTSTDDGDKIRRRLKAARKRLFTPHVRHRFNDWYQMGRKLGDGASAEVHEASAWSVDSTTGQSTRSASSRRVAVKVFRLDQQGGSDRKLTHQEVKGQQEFFRAEWEMLAQLEHPHIVRMYECFKESTALYIVMELCLGGELIEYVKEISRQRGRGGLEEEGAAHLFRQMLYAGSYLHANKIVHRDIKLENFLLIGEQQSKGSDVIKLCDFGTAVVLTDRAPRAYGRIGTLSYTSPEVCADKGATVLSDAWSLGVVLYVLLVGAKPFRSKIEEPREETMRRIQNGAFNQARPGWKAVSSGSRDLVKQLITVEEAVRLTSWDALKHSWLVNGLEEENGDGRDNHVVNDSGRTVRIGQQEPDPLASLTQTAADELRLLSQATSLDHLQRFVLSTCARLTGEAELLRQSVWSTWYNLFFTLDANKDGMLDFSELARGMWAVSLPRARPSALQLKGMVQVIDLNMSGAIEWNEWAAASLVSADKFSCKDELLATVLRLTRRSQDDLPGDAGMAEDLSSAQPQAPETDWEKLPVQDAPAAHSAERAVQVRELMASWTNPQEDLLTNLMAGTSVTPSTPSVGLADLREVLSSTSWINSEAKILTGSATPRQPSRESETIVQASVSSRTQFEMDLAASPLPSPRGGVVAGPIVLPSARCVIPGSGTGSDSEPNSPRGLCASASEDD